MFSFYQRQNKWIRQTLFLINQSYDTLNTLSFSMPFIWYQRIRFSPLFWLYTYSHPPIKTMNITRVTDFTLKGIVYSALEEMCGRAFGWRQYVDQFKKWYENSWRRWAIIHASWIEIALHRQIYQLPMLWVVVPSAKYWFVIRIRAKIMNGYECSSHYSPNRRLFVSVEF